MSEKYLKIYHRNNLLTILKDKNENKHFSLPINFLELFENDPKLGNSFLKEPEKTLDEWNNSILNVENIFIDEFTNNNEENLIFKKYVNCRIFGLPVCPDLHRNLIPTNEDVNKFLQISGTVIRISSTKLLEYQRQYICTKCKFSFFLKADYDKKNIILQPKKCINPSGECKGKNFTTFGNLNVDCCKDYQEIKIQEIVSKLEYHSIPNSMWITLEDDLVDSCKPGDNITVCGIVKRRWGTFNVGRKIDIDLVLKANHIQINNNNISGSLITPEIKETFDKFWKNYLNNPLYGRDIILKSFCPQIFGFDIVKLALAIILAGGNQNIDKIITNKTGVNIRAEPHLLLVGDPGTGKSQLLKYAAKIIPRSVFTTGIGSTAAGLTVTALMESGEWHLEGGALVLADGGICCIDEFNSMKEHDRTSIHEAMEQQSISVAKANIVCKLSTKCSVLAATNPKNKIDPLQPLSMNIGLAAPLLSRFDLILLIRDNINKEWDQVVSKYILNTCNNISKFNENNELWSIEMLQSYFAIIKKINPELTENSNKIIQVYYQAHRSKNIRNKSRTTIRLLESLIRLSQGHAKLMYHNKVEIIDAIFAVILMETSMEDEYSLFNLHFDIFNSFSNNYNDLIKIILNKLQLNDLIEKESEFLNKINFLNKKEKSRYFNLKENNYNSDDNDKNINLNDILNFDCNNKNELNLFNENNLKIFENEQDINDINLDL